MPAMVLSVQLRSSGVDTGSSTSPATGSRHSSAMLQKAVPLRRRRSKGTIAGFASSSPAGDSTDLSHNDGSSGGTTASIVDNASSSDGISQPQHAGDASSSGTPSAPQKPCHSARLALLCVSNAIHMGGRTQINLCPPGKASEDLLKILQDRRKKKKAYQVPMLRRSMSNQRTPSLGSVGSRIEESSTFDKVIGEAGIAEYEKAEEDYLNNLDLHAEEKSSQNEDIQADASSGDEDMLESSNFNDDMSTGKDKGDDYDDSGHGEPLYTLASDSSAPTSGKIAFNLRKLKWFDSVTASDRAKARQYLRQELFNLKKKDTIALTKHIKKLQRREKRRVEIERGMRNSDEFKSENSDEDDDDDFRVDEAFGISKLPDDMTPSLSAALVLESLTLMPLESIEGMSKCYEGIVAAGTALLDSETEDTGTSERKKPSKSEIMGALTPLLTTTLEKASGETILALAKLRKMCGTKRYQRRFVQRIAPSLVRPPNAAMWCLRHQNEMEAILVATEMILDASFDIFSSGWFERGRTLLADSQRAETLKAAATQLKQLSSNQNSDFLMKGLSAIPGSQRRGGSRLTTTPNKDISGSTDVLAEWEVLAVDIQIRQSIANIFTSDWSRVTLTNAPPRDGESYTNQRTKIRGISAAKAKATDNLHVDTFQTGEQSSHSSSPSRVTKNSSPAQDSPTKENTSVVANVVAISKDSYNEPSSNNVESESPPLTPKQDTNHLFVPVIGTPPRSPPNVIGTISQQSSFRSPKKKVSSTTPPLAQLPQFLDSPGASGSNISASGSIGAPAPLSPSNSSYGGRQESSHQRYSSNSSTASSATQSTYLRTLTSTAAERKRTVAACRALRAQITRFEEAFIKVHGRPPKGAAERAPLATTYAQYREWKRAIRADAACRIQALFRGARIRWLLMKSDNQRIKQVVKKRAGRPGYATSPRNPQPTFPLDLRDKISNHRVRDNSTEANSYGVEVVIDQNSEDGNMPTPRRMSNEEHVQYSSGHHNRFSPRTEGSVSLSTLSSVSTPSLNDLSLPELQVRKRELKQQLKRYDMNFYQTHGRVPKKQEKEPIRHLYESYNALKTQITQLESNGSAIHQTPPSIRRSPIPSPMSISSHADASNSSSLEDSPMMAPTRPRGRPNYSQHNINNTIPNGSSHVHSASQELAALKTEKQNLHQMLRQYERDFFRMHNRQVASYTDIRPVASQYRRYKEIKRSISALQARGQG